jgi:hypothetical protein
MARGLNKGIAKALAILSVVAMMGSPVDANDEGVSLPQSGTDSVVMRLSATLPDDVHPSERLQVFVGSADPCCEGRTPMAGSYALSEGTLTFSPAFGFDPGQDYVARVWTSGNDHALHAFRLAHEVAAVPAAVTETYPSGETIPENTLRFYIHFSTPMRPQVAFDYIKLQDGFGTVDDAAFMQFKQELWNEDRTRLTVLIDPGRIKREVATNVALGPALRAEQQYTLSVDGGWPSADGASVLPPFSRTFTVSSALRERPDVGLWQTAVPCVGTTDPLHIAFDRPFDRHLLSKDIQVVAKDGRMIGGMIHVGAGETSWRFTPNEAWTQSEFIVVASTDLEDVAGNNFRDLLDHLETTENTEVAPYAFPITLNGCSQ